MKILTKKFSVTIFENGSICWKNAKFTDKSLEEIESDLTWSFFAILILLAVLWIK